VPYVFRPVEGAKSTFTLVGEAYIHGLMDNAADYFEAGDLTLESIQIL